MNFIFIFITLAGFCIAIGAVTVIDWVGFFGIRSAYWTQVAIRAHKVTKVLIWIGIVLASSGLVGLYYSMWDQWFAIVHAGLFAMLAINGLYLHFAVSVPLLRRERFWLDNRILPRSLQQKILPGMIISFVGWWSALALFVWVIVYAI